MSYNIIYVDLQMMPTISVFEGNHSEELAIKPFGDSPCSVGVTIDYERLTFNTLSACQTMYNAKHRSCRSLLKASSPVLSELAEPACHYFLDQYIGPEKAQLFADVSKGALEFVKICISEK